MSLKFEETNLHGVQGVGGSNPLVPTILDQLLIRSQFTEYI